MKLLNLKSKEIKEIIAKDFGDKMKKLGYQFKKSTNEFILVESDYSFYFNMLLTSWSDHYSLDIRLYIYQRQIETIFKKITGSSQSLTMGNEIGIIFNSPDGRKKVNGSMHLLLMQDQDIESAVETLIHYNNTIAQPYFEKYHSLMSIDDIFNNPPFDTCPAHVGGNFDERCMKGLIVARLVDNPHFEDLENIYNERIKETMDSESIDNYHEVKEFLKHNRIK